jgi:hypothetical protein
MFVAHAGLTYMRISVTAALAAASLVVPATADAAGYTYTTIASSSASDAVKATCPTRLIAGQVRDLGQPEHQRHRSRRVRRHPRGRGRGDP